MKLSDIKITVLHLCSKSVPSCTSPIKTDCFRALRHVPHGAHHHFITPEVLRSTKVTIIIGQDRNFYRNHIHRVRDKDC